MLNEVSFVLLLISWYLLSPIDAYAFYRWSWPKIPTPASFSKHLDERDCSIVPLPINIFIHL